MATISTLKFGTARQLPPEPLEIDPTIGMKDLPRFGINYSRTHLRRMWKSGKFPEPFHLTPNRLAWRRSVILAWIKKREEASR